MSDAAQSGPIAIVIGHGEFAAGIVSAVNAISGRGDRFIALSNAGLGREGIERLLSEHIDGKGIRVVFTDLPAGSCNMAAGRLLIARDDIVVVAGVSLPVLLQFVMNDAMPPRDAAQEAVQRAGNTLKVMPGGRRGH
jgi:PTS system N-acetylgalactosamine-specific IIA component